MLTLAIDTSTDTAGLALLEDDLELAEMHIRARMRQLRRLVPDIDWLMQRCERKLSDIGLLAVGIGPGSFTGLRIGMATARGFSQALACPVAPIPSLDVLAAGAADGSDLVCAMMDARHDRVYAAVYGRCPRPGAVCVQQDRLYRLGDYQAPLIEQLITELQAEQGSLLPVGDGALLHACRLRQGLGPRMLPPETDCRPRALVLGRLAASSAVRLCGQGLYSLSPLYVRRSSAEREKCSHD